MTKNMCANLARLKKKEKNQKEKHRSIELHIAGQACLGPASLTFPSKRHGKSLGSSGEDLRSCPATPPAAV